MRAWIAIICAGIMLVAVAAVGQAPDAGGKEKAAEKKGPTLDLSGEILYFTEPYTKLKPPIKNMIAMCLDVDYAQIKYPLGFVNTLDSTEPLINYQKRIQITGDEEIEKIREMSGLRTGDRITMLSAEGRVYPARIASFSYVGNSPSTIMVAADLVIESRKIDPSVWNSHGVALRGMREIQTPPTVGAQKPLDRDAPLKQKLLNICAGNLDPGYIIQDVNVLPAVLDKDGCEFYFVSYWKRPEDDFEIEEYELAACMFKPSGEAWAKASLPLPFQLIQVYDLDSDGKGEIFAMTGDGQEICYIYLAPTDEGKYRIIRKGLCAGY